MGNEEALCGALIRLLETEMESARSEVSFPERDGLGPPVEIRLRIGGRRFAIEHTLIEPFPRAIQMSVEFGELTAEIEARLNGTMPTPGIYTLIFPVHPTNGIHRRAHDGLRARITAWIVKAAQELHDECPERRDRNHSPSGYRGSRTTEIDGIPLRLSRQVHWSESGRHDGTLFLVRNAGDDVESLRLERMRTALARKLPKLRECAVLGDTTLLILEWSDIALSNHIVNAEALRAAIEERDDCPDRVLLADTTTELWHFFQPIIDGEFSIDMEHTVIETGSA